MRTRGLGRVYQPTWRDRTTGEQKVSPTWWLAYSWRGEKKRESSHSTKRADAVRLLRKRLEEMGQGRLVGPDAEKVTLKDLLGMVTDDYAINGRRSAKRVKNAANRLTEHFGERARALDLTTDRLTGYVKARQEDAQPATVQYELAVLRRGFTLAVKAGRLSHRPAFPTLRVDNVRRQFIEDADLERVIAHLPEGVRPIVAFLNLTGWRLSEVTRLTWADVDFRHGAVRAETSKNSRPKVFPFWALPELKALLERQREVVTGIEKRSGRIIPQVWVWADGRPVKDFRTSWNNACAKAGVPGRWRHDLKRGAIRRFERSTLSRSVAMALTGNLTESVYRRYAIVNESDLAEGVAKLARLHGGQEDNGQRSRVLPFHERKGKARAKQGQN